MDETYESKYSPELRKFVIGFNRRTSPTVSIGSDWIRFVPPDDNDIKAIEEDPRIRRFMLVGSSVKIKSICNSYLIVDDGNYSLCYDEGAFLSTFIKISRPEKPKRA